LILDHQLSIAIAATVDQCPFVDERHSLIRPPRMSALGHKRTFAVHNGMSALPPIATEKADAGALVQPVVSYRFA
jgi:hypothetical protein